MRAIYCLVVVVAVAACNKDDNPDPYQPVTLPKINRLDLINGNDSTIYIYNANMVLTSGRDNTMTGIKGYEWFTMEYADEACQQLSGALYKVANDPSAHMTERQVTYARNNRNMLATVTREEWASKSFSFSYDDQYRLTQLTLNESGAINRYTIAYDNRSNVSSIEIYRKVSDVEGNVKQEFSGYDNHLNPFRFLANVFYAPVFSSNNGAVFFNKMSLSLGSLLSVNNPGSVMSYIKNGNDWEEDGSLDYVYEYSPNNYPVSISGNGLSLEIKYH